ncbi:hypothetical protein BJ958_004856 [Nocardioides kongjuensis]|uniref:Uncharacterized protein n=1 Tax=Nocardioides kongjuensis TaxID=349522 RepID=A0A852RWR8_9ACTN|nr:hypothetical protein [Nocardioides kongjuensis]
MVDGGFGTGQTYGARMVDLDLWMAMKGRAFRRIFHLWKKTRSAKLTPFPGEW